MEKHLIKLALGGALLALLFSCAGGGSKGGGDWVYGIIVYVDSTSINRQLSDSLYIHCVPGVSSLERIGVDRFRVGGMQGGRRYKLSVKFGLEERLLATETVYKTGQEIVLRIPKSIENSLRPVDTRDVGGTKDGRVVKEN